MGSTHSIEYQLSIWVSGRIDPDDPRPIKEQADEWVEQLVNWILDTSPGAIYVEARGLRDNVTRGGPTQSGGAPSFGTGTGI